MRETGQGSIRAILSAAGAVFLRDCVAETRQWHALNAIVMYGLIALTAVSLGLKGQGLTPTTAASLFWVVEFFTAMSSLSRSFVREEDARTSLALRLSAPPAAVYLGKLWFNFILVLALNVLLVPGFLLLVSGDVRSPALLIGAAIMGALALAAASTILGAMAARAGSRSALFSVLSFPVLLPILASATHATAVAFGAAGEASGDLRFIGSYGIMCVIAALMLFPYVWWS